MPNRDDALDRYVDDLVQGSPHRATPPDLDPSTAAVVRHLFGGRRGMPSPTFVAELEARLVAEAQGSRSLSARAGWGRSNWRPPLRFGVVAVLALLLVTVGASAILSDRDGNRLSYLPAAEATALSPAAVIDCEAHLQSWTSVQSWLLPRYNQLLAAQIPAVLRPSPTEPNETIRFIPTSALPHGAPPSRVTVSKINAGVAREFACIGTMLPMGADTSLGPSSPSGAGASANQGETHYVTARPAQAVQTLLADGRVGALVWDEGGDTGTYFVLGPAGADWLLTEVAAVATDAYITAHPGAPHTDQITIYVNDVRVISIPARFDLAAGSPVDIKVVNDGTRDRQFAIPSAGIELTLASGEERTVTVTLPEGGHRYTVDVNPNGDLKSGGWLWAFPDMAVLTPSTSPDTSTNGLPGSPADEAVGMPSGG